MKRNLIAALCLSLWAFAASAQRVETGGGQKIIGNGGHNTYYAPAFAYGEPNCNKPDVNGVPITGDCVFLYVQGDANLGSSDFHDQILMFWNPNTWAGLTSKYAGGERLLPGVDYQGVTMPAQHNYGHPSVFQYNGNYYMTATQSPDAREFKKQWWGVSPDGKSWTWYPLFNYTGADDIKMPGLTLQPRTVGGVLYFYGFVEVWRNNGFGTGAVRLRANAARARGYDLVQMYTSSGWTTIVNADTNPAGNFSSGTPVILWHGRSQPKYIGEGELWWSVSGGQRDCVNCGTFSGPYSGLSDRFGYVTVTIPSATAAPAVSAEGILRSNVRCMPGKYDNSRVFPMPLGAGSPRLLYSATNDDDFGSGAYCNTVGIDTYPGMYIVVTAF